jgi:hypothetical protein
MIHKRISLLAVAVLIVICSGSSLSHEVHLEMNSSDIVIEHLWTLGQGQDEFNVTFGNIGSLAAGPDGYLYVLDTGLSAVTAYDAGGVHIGDLQIPEGEGPGEMFVPFDVSVDERGYIYVIDRQARRVSAFDGAEWEYVGSHTLSFMPTQVAASDDQLFITSFWFTDSFTLHRFDPSTGSTHALLPRPDDWQDIAATGNVERMATTPENTVLYSYPYPYRIIEVSEHGEILRKSEGHPSFEGPPEEEEGTTVLPERTRGLALLSSGHVAHVAANETEETIYLDVFTRELTFLERVDLTEEFLELPRPYVAAGPDNRLCFTYRDQYEMVTCYQVQIED